MVDPEAQATHHTVRRLERERRAHSLPGTSRVCICMVVQSLTQDGSQITDQCRTTQQHCCKVSPKGRTRRTAHAVRWQNTTNHCVQPQQEERRSTRRGTATHRAPPRKRTARTQPPLCALSRANTSERTSKRAADAATLLASKAHRPVPPARRAASQLLAMPSNITGALPARMESKGAHPVNIVRQWLRQDARGFARITHDSDGALLTEDGRYGGREWQQRRGAHAPRW